MRWFNYINLPLTSYPECDAGNGILLGANRGHIYILELSMAQSILAITRSSVSSYIFRFSRRRLTRETPDNSSGGMRSGWPLNKFDTDWE